MGVSTGYDVHLFAVEASACLVSVYISRLTSVPGCVGPGQRKHSDLGPPSEQPDTVSTAESDQNRTVDDTLFLLLLLLLLLLMMAREREARLSRVYSLCLCLCVCVAGRQSGGGADRHAGGCHMGTGV
jgi:hypothetical protein